MHYGNLSDHKALIAFGVGVFICLNALVYFAHRNDALLKAACEAKGGVFVHARDPMHICVMPAGE